MSFRHALQPIINNPPAHASVVFYDDVVVILEDRYPKSFRHYLVVPRAPSVSKLHPLVVFDDDRELYEKIAKYVDIAKTLILSSLHCQFPDASSKTIDSWQNFIQAGIHSQPSLTNLHIHVMTRDFLSPSLKNRKHYNSFTTPFFVHFARLAPDSEPMLPIDVDQVLKLPLRCSYCFTEFPTIPKLKAHLKLEFNRKCGSLGSPVGSMEPNATKPTENHPSQK